jgi:hypothetical protein
MDLQATDAKKLAARQTTHMISGLDLAAESGSRYDDAMALHDEGSVHGQSKVAISWGFVGALKCLGN